MGWWILGFAVIPFLVYRLVRRFCVRRFIAGKDIKDVIRAVKTLNRRGIRAEIDFLGESVRDRDASFRAIKVYLALLDAIRKNNLNACVSLKPSQFGLDFDAEFCVENLQKVIARARELKIFVWLDMEDYSRKDKTLKLFSVLRSKFENVGVALQSFLFDTVADLDELKRQIFPILPSGKVQPDNFSWNCLAVRLCRGAYRESSRVTFPSDIDSESNLLNLLVQSFHHPGHPSMLVYPAIASHRERIINFAEIYAASQRIPKCRFEFQFLLGMRRKRQEELAAKGYKVTVYVPFGKNFGPYISRRLTEWPFIKFLLTNFFKR